MLFTDKKEKSTHSNRTFQFFVSVPSIVPLGDQVDRSIDRLWIDPIVLIDGALRRHTNAI
jgi:hypothetical protein